MVQEKKNTQSTEKQQAEAMDKIGTLLERALPRDVKEFTEKYVANMESQFIEPEGEVAVLDISTATLATIDAIPGFYDEELPGQFTKEGLPKYKRWRLVVNHVPVTDHVYSVTSGVKLADYEEEMAKKSKGMVDGHSEVASLMLRIGGDA